MTIKPLQHEPCHALWIERTSLGFYMDRIGVFASIPQLKNALAIVRQAIMMA